jgi:hypothetical protein
VLRDIFPRPKQCKSPFGKARRRPAAKPWSVLLLQESCLNRLPGIGCQPLPAPALPRGRLDQVDEVRVFRHRLIACTIAKQDSIARLDLMARERDRDLLAVAILQGQANACSWRPFGCCVTRWRSCPCLARPSKNGWSVARHNRDWSSGPCSYRQQLRYREWQTRRKLCANQRRANQRIGQLPTQ